jgi:hypothetical protein
MSTSTRKFRSNRKRAGAVLLILLMVALVSTPVVQSFFKNLASRWFRSPATADGTAPGNAGRLATLGDPAAPGAGESDALRGGKGKSTATGSSVDEPPPGTPLPDLAKRAQANAAGKKGAADDADYFAQLDLKDEDSNTGIAVARRAYVPTPLESLFGDGAPTGGEFSYGGFQTPALTGAVSQFMGETWDSGVSYSPLPTGPTVKSNGIADAIFNDVVGSTPSGSASVSPANDASVSTIDIDKTVGLVNDGRLGNPFGYQLPPVSSFSSGDFSESPDGSSAPDGPLGFVILQNNGLDNGFAAAAVPEPSMLLMVGLGGLLVGRRTLVATARRCVGR